MNEYAEQGYTYAVDLDLEKYFDTINYSILLKLLREQIEDERAVQMAKRYLKSGVMEDGVVVETEEKSPQSGPLSPLLANIYLNEFDKEYSKRGVPFVRYADDIVILAKSKRAAERLLESSIRYLEGRLKLTINREKSRVVSVYSVQNFKFLGFAIGKNGLCPRSLEGLEEVQVVQMADSNGRLGGDKRSRSGAARSGKITFY